MSRPGELALAVVGVLRRMVRVEEACPRAVALRRQPVLLVVLAPAL